MMPLNPRSSPMLVTITRRTLVRPSTSATVRAKFSTTTITSAPESVELVLELARRVERVDVHHRAAGAQRAEQAHRVLQDIGHHQRDARALLAAVRLQVRAERGGQPVELGEGDRLAHAGERGARRELRRALLEHVADRLVLVDVDLGGHAFRIVFQPDLFHGPPPPKRMRRRVAGQTDGPDSRVPARVWRRFSGRRRRAPGMLHQKPAALRRRMAREPATGCRRVGPGAAAGAAQAGAAARAACASAAA